MDLTLFQKPQVSLSRSTSGRMWTLFAAAFLPVFQSSLGDSFHSMLLAAASVAGAVLAELLLHSKTKDPLWSIKDGSAAASGMALALFLPNQLNPFYAFVGAVFAMAVIKYSFGGLGSNWLNPAAGAWLFIRTAWPETFRAGLEGSLLGRLNLFLEQGLRDLHGSPLTMLKITGWQEHARELPPAAFLNGTVFSLSGTRLPEGYLSLFSVSEPGIIADRGLLFMILGAALLAASGSFRFWTPVLFLFVYAALTRIFGALPFGGVAGRGDMLFALFSGGVIAAAFVLITDPATGPKSESGSVVYVVFTALFAWLFRFYGREPYGVLPALLLGNAFSPLIRYAENRLYYEKRRST
jgi:electron transport complex protein RnfD